MKILKIFGLVVGVHAVAFMFVFAIPGCRSTTRHSPPPAESVQAESTRVHAAPPTPIADSSPSIASPISAGGATDQMASPSPVDSSVSSSNAPTITSGFPMTRSNPTRPGSAAAIGLEPTLAPTTTPATTYVVVSGDNLWKIAKKHGMSSKEIAAANNLRVDAPLREGQKLTIPGKAIPRSSASSVPTGNPAETLSYRVKSGETLAVIARRSGTTSAAIKSLNHLKSDNLHAGQELLLPAGGAAALTLAAAPEETTSGKGKNSGGVHHIVKAGETLGLIAKHYGVTRRDLAVANNIADPLKLRAGQDLIIPGKAGMAQKSSTAVPANSTLPETTASVPAPTAVPAVSNSPVESPIAPAPSTDATAITPTPPVIQVQDSNPVSPSK